MICNKKVVNYKVVDLIKIYNFASGRFSIWGHLYNSKKNWISQYENFKQNSGTINDCKWKGINYKVEDLDEIYNFIIKFAFIRLYLRKL
jgi:hypothetical protein